MKNIGNFIIEKLHLSNQSKLQEPPNDEEVENLAEYIIGAFNISHGFFRYKQLKDALIKYIINNNITKDKLNTPYINGSDMSRYKARGYKYRPGRYRRVTDAIKNASIIVGDPNNDYIVFYFSNECLLCHSTDLSNIQVNIFFLIH